MTKARNKASAGRITRRDILSYLAATSAGACCGGTAQALGGDSHAHGLMGIHGSCQLQSLAPAANQGSVRIIPSLGSKALDDLVLSERNPLNRSFGVSPDLYVFDDGGVPNAFAVPHSKSGRGQGTILLGQTLVIDELKKTGYSTGSLKGIMAHEWTHIVQFRDQSALSSKHRELHSDFMAGWYLRHSGAMGRNVDFQTFANTLYAKGDFGFYNKVHHGTPNERVSAMLVGSQLNKQNFWDAYRYGERLVPQRFA